MRKCSILLLGIAVLCAPAFAQQTGSISGRVSLEDGAPIPGALITATSEVLGKTAGKDERAGKATFPALYGLEASRSRAGECVDRALGALRSAGLADERLEALARFTLARGA